MAKVWNQEPSEISLPFRKRSALNYYPEVLIFILGLIRSLRSIVLYDPIFIIHDGGGGPRFSEVPVLFRRTACDTSRNV